MRSRPTRVMLAGVVVKSSYLLYNRRMAKKRIPRDLVLAMRGQHGVGHTIEEIRLAYGYSRRTVSDLVNHRTHKRVRLAPNESRDVPPLPGQESTPPQPTKARTPGVQERVYSKIIRKAALGH